MAAANMCESHGGPSSFCLALRAAVRKADMRQYEIAAKAGISLRTLQRFLGNKSLPSPKQQKELLSICNVVPETSILSADLGYEKLIGTSFQAYADIFVPLLYSMLDRVSNEQTLPIDPRWATVEANMIKARWETMLKRREEAAFEGLIGRQQERT